MSILKMNFLRTKGMLHNLFLVSPTAQLQKDWAKRRSSSKSLSLASSFLYPTTRREKEKVDGKCPPPIATTNANRCYPNESENFSKCPYAPIHLKEKLDFFEEINMTIKGNVKAGLYGLVVGATMMGAATSYARDTPLEALPEAVQQVYKEAETCKDVSATTLASLPEPMLREIYWIGDGGASKKVPIIFTVLNYTSSPEKSALAVKYNRNDPDLMKGIDDEIRRETFPHLTLDQFYTKIDDNNWRESVLDPQRESRRNHKIHNSANDHHTVHFSSSLVDDYLVNQPPIEGVPPYPGLDLRNATLTGEWKCVDIHKEEFQETSDFKLFNKGTDFWGPIDPAKVVLFELTRKRVEGENFVLVYKVE